MNVPSLRFFRRVRSLGLQARSLLYLLSVGLLLSALLTWRASYQQKALVFEELERRGRLLAQNLAQAALLPLFLEDQRALRDLLSKSRMEEDVAYIVIYDRSKDARLTTGSQPTRLWKFPPLDRPMVIREQEYLHVISPILETVDAGSSDPRPAALRPKKEIGWVHVCVSTRRAVEDIERFVKQSAAGTTGILALGGGLAFLFFSRTVVSPLHRLAEATREVSRGNLDQQIGTLGKTKEFSSLAEAFNAMVVDLKRAKDQLMRVNQELEERVQERTYALEAVNRDLLRANVHLEELVSLKSRFVSMVSHELRTPIASIKGFVLTLLRFKDRLGPEKTDQHLRIIQQESERLSRLIEELLDISRIQEGRLEIHPAPVDLHEVIERVMDRYRLKSARVRFELKREEADCRAYVDPDKVEQVLVNLFDNALRFSPDGGGIVAHSFYQQTFAVLEILDEGPGLPREEIEKIFEPFYRVDNEVNTRNPGTGLGLAISRSLSEAMGGHLWAGNRDPKGACFALMLPRAPIAAPAAK